MTTPPENEENYNNCLCEGCPSYPGHGDKKLYCARGKSQYKINMETCICPMGCPVYAKYKLGEMYYCAYGKGK